MGAEETWTTENHSVNDDYPSNANSLLAQKHRTVTGSDGFRSNALLCIYDYPLSNFLYCQHESSFCVWRSSQEVTVSAGILPKDASVGEHNHMT